MRIQVISGRSVVETTLAALFDALRSVARSEAEVEAVSPMGDETVSAELSLS